ncbi:sensor histidine kinase [Glycomyces sp. A-F 0318]|uniref:sensor histidine kinase n=1 Tax=Glycomyces amatae TaxID=2881355 RepID=UPI001E5AD1A2|nr:sensor histidine kinase [Glycomyces amatae]MCD0447238.1 sensor histidine kinase [Glycomyces amatae]
MRRIGADIWGGVFVTLVGLAMPVPVVVAHFQGDDLPVIPTGWWLAVYAGFFAAFTTGMWLIDLAPRRAVWTALAAQSVLAPVLVLTAPGAGWTPILLVLSVAVSAYTVPPRVASALIALNTAVVAVATARFADTAFEIGMVAALYLMLQAASVLSVHAQLHEVESRRRLAEAHVRLRAAAALQDESSRTEERLRIARELHDAVGHQLTVLSLELEIASHRAGPEAAESVDRAKAVTRQLLSDVRATVGEMRQGGPRLRETLESVVADLPAPAVHLRIDDAVEADAELTRALLRCVQEVVTNAIRHSRAENLWIAIDSDGERVTFDARDDGLGSAAFEPGNGLRGMAERLEALGGAAEFSGEDGFRVRAAVPA